MDSQKDAPTYLKTLRRNGDRHCGGVFQVPIIRVLVIVVSSHHKVWVTVEHSVRLA